MKNPITWAVGLAVLALLWPWVNPWTVFAALMVLALVADWWRRRNRSTS